jgi:hypothetical protein
VAEIRRPGFPDIGFQGFTPKLAKGEIASLSGAPDEPRYFQISVPVQPTNSGGALVDERGHVIGIVSARLDASVVLAATAGAASWTVHPSISSSHSSSSSEPPHPAALRAAGCGGTTSQKFHRWQICGSLGSVLWPFP